MGNTDLDACVQVVKQTASLSSLIADALRNKRDIPTFVVDVSNILHAQLHAHDMDIVLRNSWKGFEQGIENILKIHASWFAPYDPVTYIRRVVHYTEEVPLKYMIYVFDGATFTDKRANLLRKKILEDAHRSDPTATLAVLYDKGLSSYYDFEKAGIVVILPDKKHEGQIVFSGKSQEGGRDVAGGRIIIENLNEQLKLYDMFGAVKYISRLDMVEHELNFVRFLVNLKPVVNNWNSKTAHTF